MRLRLEQRPLDGGIACLVCVIYIALLLIVGTQLDAGVLGTMLVDGIMILVLGVVYTCCVKPYAETKSSPNRLLFLGLAACAAGCVTVPFFDIRTTVPSLGYCILTLFFAPVFEELLFRGIFFSYFRKYLHWFAALVLCSGVFALLHGSYVQLYSGFVLGLSAGLLYHRTGKIYLSILLHFMYNLVMTFLAILVPVSVTLAVVLNLLFLAVFLMNLRTQS